MLNTLQQRVPAYQSITSSTTQITVDNQTYHKPPVESEALRYLSKETMDELIEVVLKAKKAIGQANEAAVLKELNLFLDSLSSYNEISDIS